MLHVCVYGRADDCRHIKVPPRRQEARLHARRLQLGVVPVERKALLGYERHVARRRQRRGAEPRRRRRPLERGIAGVEHAVLRAVTRCFAGRGSRARFAGKESSPSSSDVVLLRAKLQICFLVLLRANFKISVTWCFCGQSFKFAFWCFCGQTSKFQ